jgi:hypothetical protein
MQNREEMTVPAINQANREKNGRFSGASAVISASFRSKRAFALRSFRGMLMAGNFGSPRFD